MRRTFIAGLLVVIACGGGTGTDVRTRSGPTQFAGKYAVFFQYDAWVTSISAGFDTDGGTSGEDLAITALDLWVMDAPWDCSSLDGGPQPVRDVAELIWSINRPKPRVLTTGEYVLGSLGSPGTEDWSGGDYFDWRPECLAQWSVITGGSVQLTRLTDTAAEGFMSASLYDGTLIEGDFAATRCPAVFPEWPDGGIPEPLPRCEG